jgi:deoxyribodipyrimidine photo-lyase
MKTESLNRHKPTDTDRAVRRDRALNRRPAGAGPVLCWLTRDLRAEDNWALLHAAATARERRVPVLVAYQPGSGHLLPSLRHLVFLEDGLREMERDLAARDIPFILLGGTGAKPVTAFVKYLGIGEVVTDFYPLRHVRRAQQEAARDLPVRLTQVDAHNVVPAWTFDRLEYAARTLRPKLERLLPSCLDDFPRLAPHPFAAQRTVPPPNWNRLAEGLKVDGAVAPVERARPGAAAGRAVLASFLKHVLIRYDEDRNDPAKGGQSGLSPWLHFGLLAPQRVALAVASAPVPAAARQAFLEELVVRRELADNYCLHEPEYDNPGGWPDWARRHLREHAANRRPHVYKASCLERGATHDSLWNAAQTELTRLGKMHGFMRMYWAKKILEWTKSPEDAHRLALQLNDKYSLDGSDPNGYAGVAWAIAGLHDRPWAERPVFGPVRYMSREGCEKKFDVTAYEKRVTSE